MRNYILALALALIAMPMFAANNDAPPVKKSTTGICHETGSRYYAQTKKFTEFKTLDECIKSGGRMPKR